MRTRPAKRLLLALLGEFVLDRELDRVRAGALLPILEGAGIAAPTARATLDRMAVRGLLDRKRSGREVEFSLTDEVRDILREGGQRVNRDFPFKPQGAGWTLVTFSVSEGHRTVRHRLRAVLTWEGFAPLRDGLWIAPGEVDMAATLEPLRDDLPPRSVAAFRAREIDDFPLADAVRDAWDLDAIRAEHELFLETWGHANATDGAQSAVSARIMLVADWIALLRADPRLPVEYLGADWPAAQSLACYRARHTELASRAESEFAQLVPVGEHTTVG
ncbi:PaaX family transcriptional regulator [Paramicrobacterium fandaimingii]|uniref:PaaX family transcriptional regulator n=1 Tax=Paramicrobacterium fandaimingii TaxID=2708079 RepID=UPI00141EBF42|nr:PaaX family transcriptional regulator C-terminal domain-containing protein [Microbacterium fandaimingii]